MANYTPVAQNESSVDSLADETFATDRDKSDAKLHHLEKDRFGKHHLVSPQVVIKHPSIMRQPTNSPGVVATVPSSAVQSNNIPFVPGQQQGSVGQPSGANNNAVVTGGGGGIKPNVTFKLSDDSDKVLPVKRRLKLLLFFGIFFFDGAFFVPFITHMGHGRLQRDVALRCLRKIRDSVT